MIKDILKSTGFTWAKLERDLGENPRNLKGKFDRYLFHVNRILSPLGYEVVFKKKKP